MVTIETGSKSSGNSVTDCHAIVMTSFALRFRFSWEIQFRSIILKSQNSKNDPCKSPNQGVLIEAGAVRAVEVAYAADVEGWTVAITHASRRGERREVPERQRGGARGFTILDAVARCLAWPDWACRRSGWTRRA